MKKVISILLITAMALFSYALAETEITVNGNGIISVPADAVTLSLGVSESAESAIEAQQLTNEKITAVRTALIEAGIPESDISSAAITLSQNYDTFSVEPENPGYCASTSLSVRVSDPEKAGSLIDLSIDAGVNYIYGLYFSLKDPNAYNKEVIDAACEDARTKAELYAQAMGVTITGIKSVNETYSEFYNETYDNVSTFGNIAKRCESTNVSINNVDLATHVSVTFTAE